MSATSRRGFRLPRLGFGKRKLETAARKAGLPEEVRREAALGDQASEAKAWPRALTHYDAAIQTLTARSMEEGTEAGAVGDLYFRRGVARFNQAQTSLAAGQTERSVSDYQIAIEMIRLAAADYSEAIRLNPRWSMGYYRRGEAHLFAARCERGSRSFRRSSEELRSAVEDLTCATDRNPTFASAFALRAVAHALLENDQASEADIEKTVSLGIDPAVLRKAIQASKAWRA